MKKVLFALLAAFSLLGCATNQPYGPGAAAGSIVGGYGGYVIIESMSNANPMLSILGAVGGAALGRQVGSTFDKEGE